MKKYYCTYEIDGMKIKELNEIGQENRSHFEKITKTYNSVKLFDSIEEAIEHLGNYTKEVKLPNNEIIIPDSINYPEMQFYYILKPVRFPIFEA